MNSPISFRAATLALALLAGFALAGCGGSAGADASQIVAKVNREEISVHQVNFQMQRSGAIRPDQLDAAGRQIVDRLVEQELAVQAALDSKLDREPQVMQALAAARREVLAKAFASRTAEAAGTPDANEVAAYQAARPALFGERRLYTLQELVVQATPVQVEALRQRLGKASKLADVTDYLKAAGLPWRGNLSTQPAERLPPELLDRLFTMRDGQAMMLAAPGGARIIVRASSQAAPLSAEAARPIVENALLVERRQMAVKRKLDALRAAADVRLFGRFASAASASAVSTPSAAVQRAATPAATPAASGSDADSVRRGLAGLK